MEYLYSLLTGVIVGGLFACGMAGIAWLVRKYLGSSPLVMFVGVLMFGFLLYLVISPLISYPMTDPAFDLIVGVLGYIIGLIAGLVSISSISRQTKKG